MKKLYVTNSTMNSNLAIYIGAYMDTIHKLAILTSNLEQSILYIIPYLMQMHITYKIYSDENTFIQDTDTFRPDALLVFSTSYDLYATLRRLIGTFKSDIISVSTKELPSSEFIQENWCSVTIYNPKTAQETYIYHINAHQNIKYLMELNQYQTIKVEWQ